MKEARQHGVPLILSELGDGDSGVKLGRTRLERGSGEGAAYDERWMQHMLQRRPELLTIDEIEPAYAPVIPVWVESSTSHGYIDNVFLTPTGDPIFAECKLWRNTEVRRKTALAMLHSPRDGRPITWVVRQFERSRSLHKCDRSLRMGSAFGKTRPSRVKQ